MTFSRSVSRGRSRSNSHTPAISRRESLPEDKEGLKSQESRSRSSRIRERSASNSKTQEREHGNGRGARDRSRTKSRSQSPSRDGRRAYRERSYSLSHDQSRSHSRSLSRGKKAQSSKIVVEKLSKNVTEGHLREIFSSYGRIQTIDLPLNRQFMTNRGTAYIVYEDSAGSESAIAHMHEAQLDGTVITVSIVLPRRAFSKSPPPIKPSRPAFSTSRHGGSTRGAPVGRYRSPPPRRGGYGGYGGRAVDWDDPRRNGWALSRSATPPASRRRERPHSRSRSHSRTRTRTRTRSPSRSPPRRSQNARSPPPRRRRRSPSYSSYSSYSRSRSRSRTPSRTRYGGRR